MIQGSWQKHPGRLERLCEEQAEGRGQEVGLGSLGSPGKMLLKQPDVPLGGPRGGEAGEAAVRQ